MTLHSVAVSDPLPGLSPVVCLLTSLDPDQSTTCEATYVVTLADMNAGSIANTATVSGAPPVGSSVSASDSVSVTATPNPSITLLKTPSRATVTAVGQTITYNFVVHNTGNVTLHGVGVADPLPGLGAVSCLLSALDPDQSTTCSATYTVTLADMNAGSIANTATVSGSPPVGASVGDADSASVTATPAPSMTVVKSATPSNVIVAGQTVNYSFVVQNTGNVTLHGVSVSDPLGGLSAIDCSSVTSLAPGLSMTCSATYSVKVSDMDNGSIVNTATVAGSPPVGAAVGATDSVTVTANAAPAIQVVKSASTTTVTAAGQTITYSFAVLNTGNATLNGITVTDPMAGLSSIDCSGITSLIPGDSMTCTATYVVTLADMNNGSIVNTATVTGAPLSGPSVTNTDSVTVTATPNPSMTLVKTASPTTATALDQTITYGFVVTNTGNVTLHGVGVSDPLPGLSAVDCLGVTMLAPGVSATCTATYTVTLADMNVGSISNTATATGVAPGHRLHGDDHRRWHGGQR